MTRSESAREKWARIVDEQRSSGLSVKQFCNQRSIPCSSFFAWRRKLGGAAAAVSADNRTAEFAAVAVADALRRDRDAGEDPGGDAAGGVSIALPGGLRVMVNHGFDRRLLLAVVDALEGRPFLAGAAASSAGSNRGES